MKQKIMTSVFAMMLVMFMVSCADDSVNVDEELTPTITPINPLNNEADVVRNDIVLLAFSETVIPSLVNTSSLT